MLGLAAFSKSLRIMKTLTPAGEKFVAELASRHGLSRESAERMLGAVYQGNGSMAQFSCPEFGSGQWMRGGMTMVSDMFNDRLKATVNDVCCEIANALEREDLFTKRESGGAGSGSSDWWPAGLGSPSSTGTQNRSRYAFFPGTRRLAIEREGKVTVYDTGDHRIGGVGQQQGGGDSMSFSSQLGIVDLSSLPVVSGAGGKAAAGSGPSTAAEDKAKETGDIPQLLEKLAKLRDAGVLSEEEFKGKKAELLARL